MNHVIISGRLSSVPVLRTLASGASLWSLEVSTEGPDGRSWSVPVSWFDPPRRQAEAMGRWSVSHDVVVVGAVRRRFYRRDHSTSSRTEVVAQQVVSASQQARVTTLVTDTVATVQAWLEAG